MTLRSADFESAASASSAIPAYGWHEQFNTGLERRRSSSGFDWMHQHEVHANPRELVALFAETC